MVISLCYALFMKTTLYRHNKTGFAPSVYATKISFNDLTFVVKGCLSYNINGEQVKIKSGDAILIKQGSTRIREESAKVEYISFNFTGVEFESLPLVFEDCISYETKLIFSLCDEIVKSSALYEDKIDDLLSLLIKILRERKKSLNENPLVSTIKKYILENMQENITLSMIASQVGYSPNYCDTIFKKYEKISVINYLINQRIIEAKRLILEGVLPIKEVATSVGYSDYNYFSRIFKKKVGCSPKDFSVS